MRFVTLNDLALAGVLPPTAEEYRALGMCAATVSGDDGRIPLCPLPAGHEGEHTNPGSDEHCRAHAAWSAAEERRRLDRLLNGSTRIVANDGACGMLFVAGPTPEPMRRCSLKPWHAGPHHAAEQTYATYTPGIDPNVAVPKTASVTRTVPSTLTLTSTLTLSED